MAVIGLQGAVEASLFTRPDHNFGLLLVELCDKTEQKARKHSYP